MKLISQLCKSFLLEWFNWNGRLPKMTPYAFTRLLCLLVFVQWLLLVEGSHFRHAVMSFVPTDADNNTVWSLIARYWANFRDVSSTCFCMSYIKPWWYKLKFDCLCICKARLFLLQFVNETLQTHNCKWMFSPKHLLRWGEEISPQA